MSDDDRRLLISTHGNLTTILGFRQTGKTQVALETAMDDAATGRKVFFGTPNAPARDDAFMRAAEMAKGRDDVAKVWLANGDEHIEFQSSGLLRFRHRAGNHVDTQVMDDVEHPIFMTTTRIIKTGEPPVVTDPTPRFVAGDEA